MRNLVKVTILVMIGAIVAGQAGYAQPAKEADSEKAGWSPQQKWFSDAKFGLFVHWGIYSALGGEWNRKSYSGEWIMEQAKIPASQYEKITEKFNPVKFEPAQWVKIAKDAGMKYITITSKQHAI
jgi:alpha-L-fucosidase